MLTTSPFLSLERGTARLTGANARREILAVTDFLGTVAHGYGPWLAATGGIAPIETISERGHPGIVQLSSTSTNVGLGFTLNPVLLPSTCSEMELEAIFKLTVMPNASNESVWMFGITTGTLARDPNYAVAFRYANYESTQWRAVNLSSAGAVLNSMSLGAGPTANAWQKLNVLWTPTGTTFTLNNAYTATLPANSAWAADTRLAPMFSLWRYTGTVSPATRLDYLAFRGRLAR